MSKKDKLSAKMDYITDVFVLAQDMYLYVDYLCYPETQEEKNLVNKSIHAAHIDRISHYVFRAMVSEVAKLYSQSEKETFSLRKLIRSLDKNGEFRSLGFPNKIVEKWCDEMDLQNELIERITILRDKVYAHTDPYKEMWMKDVSLKEIKGLIYFAATIIKTIFSELFDTYFDTNSYQFDRERFIMLKQLATAEKQRLDKNHQDAVEALKKIDEIILKE